MSRTTFLAAALGAALISMPAFAAGPDRAIILAQGGGGGGGGGSSDGSGGLSGSTPGSPGTGQLGSTPQNMQGRTQQPAQGSAVPLSPTQGRGAPEPGANAGAMQTAPGGTAVMPGDRGSQPRR
jgi:hypothetical protein